MPTGRSSSVHRTGCTCHRGNRVPCGRCVPARGPGPAIRTHPPPGPRRSVSRSRSPLRGRIRSGCCCCRAPRRRYSATGRKPLLSPRRKPTRRRCSDCLNVAHPPGVPPDPPGRPSRQERWCTRTRAPPSARRRRPGCCSLRPSSSAPPPDGRAGRWAGSRTAAPCGAHRRPRPPAACRRRKGWAAPVRDRGTARNAGCPKSRERLGRQLPARA